MYYYMLKVKKCPELKVSSCKLKKQIPCVSKGMGGHIGAIIDLPNKKCNINCGKKYVGDSIKEAKFYEDLVMMTKRKEIPKAYLKFFPKFYSNYCTRDNNTYFEIENLRTKAGLNSQVLDFKVGYKTAYTFNSGILKEKRHAIINKLSTSAKYGFRLEGKSINIIKTSLHKSKMLSLKHFSNKKKFSNYGTHPFHIFKSYFKDDKKSALKTLASLNKMIATFIIPNEQNALKNIKTSIGFIGSSILFVKGNKSSFVKLIDFAHPIILNKNTKKRHIKKNQIAILNMSNGIVSLQIHLNRFINVYMK